MIRRSPDPVALTFGAGFITLGATAIAGRVDLLGDSQWVWPAVLVAVGIIMLAAVVRRRTETGSGAGRPPAGDQPLPVEDGGDDAPRG